MLKCSICGKKITDKKNVKFQLFRFKLSPKFYCGDKCVSKRKITFWHDELEYPLSIKSDFIFCLVLTLISLGILLFILLNDLFKFNTLTLVLFISWILALYHWRIYFIFKGELNKI
ncbi:MAG: hypothetical protein ABIE36_01600 [Candidatus Diapherotrites archaeon]